MLSKWLARRAILPAFVLTSLFLLPTVAAQERSPDSTAAQSGESRAEFAAPPHIAFVDGSATVERDGVSQPAGVNAPFEPGDRLRTVAGRVEVLFPDGTALDIDLYSTIEFLSPTLLRLDAGRFLLVVAGVSNPAAAPRFQIDTPAASARTDGPGEYRVTASQSHDEGETELAVLRGSALVTTDRGSIVLAAGQRTVAHAGETPEAEFVNSARYDDFDLWARDRRDARMVSTSAEYLPQDLRMYGATFDQDGSWEYTQPYGYVWYPAVTSEWRPYYHGYWASYRHWGWTWIGSDRWTWPTHHYGRWGTSANRWFWIPGHAWAPAWVSWASAPGYVSWCALGVDGRPAVSFSNEAHRWSGWTAMPRHTFTSSGRVDRFAAAPPTIPATAAFAVQRSAPVAPPVRAAHASVPAITRGVALPRGADPARPNPRGAGAELAQPESTGVTRPSKVDGRDFRFESRGLAAGRAPSAVARPAERQPSTMPATPAVAVPRALPAAPPAGTAPTQGVPRIYSPPPRPAPAATAPGIAAPAQRAPAPAAPQAVPRTPPAQAVPRAQPAQPSSATAPAAPAAAAPAPSRPAHAGQPAAPARQNAPAQSGGATRKQ